MVCHPAGDKDNCLLDIYDVFSRYWEGPGTNGDVDDGDSPAPAPVLAILDGQVIDVEDNQHKNPETPQPSHGGMEEGEATLHDDGYADPCHNLQAMEAPAVTPDPPPRPTPTSVASGTPSLPSPARDAPSNEEVIARLAAVRPSHAKPSCTHNLFFAVANFKYQSKSRF